MPSVITERQPCPEGLLGGRPAGECGGEVRAQIHAPFVTSYVTVDRACTTSVPEFLHLENGDSDVRAGGLGRGVVRSSCKGLTQQLVIQTRIHTAFPFYRRGK